MEAAQRWRGLEHTALQNYEIKIINVAVLDKLKLLNAWEGVGLKGIVDEGQKWI